MTEVPEAGVALTGTTATDALCKDFSEGMHAASQPLTILRASLGSPDMARQSADDLRKLVRLLAKEVERLCLSFNYLQQFLIVASVQAEPEIEDLFRMMNHALEGVNLLFAEAGVILTFKSEGAAASQILVDSSRLAQALSSIFLVVLGRAQRGDEVIVQTHEPGARIEITMKPLLAAMAAMSAETRLSMSLAAANLRSQGAQMVWQAKPFAVQITLPAVTAEVPV